MPSGATLMPCVPVNCGETCGKGVSAGGLVEAAPIWSLFPRVSPALVSIDVTVARSRSMTGDRLTMPPDVASLPMLTWPPAPE